MLKYSFKLLVGILLGACIAGCSLEKESAVNRGLQNLTARYNILFNASEILRQKQEDYAVAFIDDYDQVLSVYQDTASHLATGDKDLQAVVTKANTIISTKEQSHYVGDAYLLLGKAAHLNADYYNAIEYFGYITRTYATNKALVQEARAWQIRSLVYLNELRQAQQVLDSALITINAKDKAQNGYLYAAATQYYIAAKKYPEATDMAAKAISFSQQTQQRLRLTFIMAQLQELTRNTTDAYSNYTRVVKSNAPFVMAFNAELNRIRIEDQQAGRHLSRTDRLRSLLRNENNEEFTDQIYYQLGELAINDRQTDEAIMDYNLSIKSSLKNQTQKGLSFLRLADIKFKIQADYVAAKKYYDSTLLFLPPRYPGYSVIQKKADNLQLLADRLQLIAHEDTLQTLAKLSEQERAQRIETMTRSQALLPTGSNIANIAVDNASTLPVQADNGTNVLGSNTSAPGSGFYFDNAGAVSQGFTDFKRRWGNRKLEDNWRRSVRYNSDVTINTLNTSQNVDPSVMPGLMQKSTADVAASAYRQQLIQSIPVTPDLLAQSNQRIYNAYLDLAAFYRDILDDKPEAIAVYEELIRRFPADENLVADYYNLYRLYTNVDKAKSEKYERLILAQYPNSTFAKVITDPDYTRRLGDKDAELSAFYNQLYDQYAQRQYAQVITRADELLKQYPEGGLAPQIAYLRAIASGHQEKAEPFRAELLQIASRYPNDALITPLVKQHLAYIDANQAEMAVRAVAIIDSDPNATAFIPQPVMKQPTPAAQLASIKITTVPGVKVPANKPASQNPVAAIKQTKPNNPVQQPTTPPVSVKPSAAVPVAKPSIFSNRDSTNYYFTVNVSSGTTNLASSRFGVGQFNRTTYQNSPVKHQLKQVGADNQLIYIGRFNSLNEAKDYARKIVPLLPQIMKVPADKYSFFIITQENLDKLADRKLLDSYVEYYQQNF